jgi:hypothetical protein
VPLNFDSQLDDITSSAESCAPISARHFSLWASAHSPVVQQFHPETMNTSRTLIERLIQVWRGFSIAMKILPQL